MNVLFLTPRVPFPPLRGDQVVAFHRLRLLSRRHAVSLVSFYERPSELDGISELNAYCASIRTVRLHRRRAFARAFMRARSGLPFQVLYYDTRSFHAAVRDVSAQGSFDVAHAFFIRMAQYLPDVGAANVVDAMDSLALRLSRLSATTGGARRAAYRSELRRVEAYERSLQRLDAEVIVVSEQDRPFFPGSRVTVVENGVDTATFAPGAARPRESTIALTGNMGYRPNIDAAVWFATRCFPHVRELIADARLVIAGDRPSRAVRALAAPPAITVTGRVASIADVLRGAQVAVVPLQSGSGIQNKVLEAMACGVPVVTTRIGLGGLRAVPGEQLLVADEPRDFAAEVVRVLRSSEDRERLARAGRAFVVSGHSWERAAEDVDAVYRRAAERRR